MCACGREYSPAVATNLPHGETRAHVLGAWLVPTAARTSPVITTKVILEPVLEEDRHCICCHNTLSIVYCQRCTQDVMWFRHGKRQSLLRRLHLYQSMLVTHTQDTLLG